MANVSWLRQHADDIKQQQEDVAAGASGNGRTVQVQAYQVHRCACCAARPVAAC